ncbi:hypothetical protein ACFL9T_13575 [Thermodesulfobacteriota bacterium]
MNFLKKIVIWGAVAGALYVVLSFHFIIVRSSLKLLKKSNLSLNYTIFSVKGKKVEKILAIDVLREDGIGDVLVEAGLLSEEKLEMLMEKYQEY